MVAITFLLLLVQGLVQYPQQTGNGLDEAALERMQQRAEYINQQMTRLLQELEQKSLERSGDAWGALLGWQFWAVLGILVILLHHVRSIENLMPSRQQCLEGELQQQLMEEEERGQCCCKGRNRKQQSKCERRQRGWK